VYATTGCSGQCLDLVGTASNYDEAYYEIRSLKTFTANGSAPAGATAPASSAGAGGTALTTTTSTATAGATASTSGGADGPSTAPVPTAIVQVGNDGTPRTLVPWLGAAAAGAFLALVL
jgi:hypothetical protein